MVCSDEDLWTWVVLPNHLREWRKVELDIGLDNPGCA